MSKSNDQMSSPLSGDDHIGGDVDRNLVSRVRKLMDKAAATANVHEADAFSRKAAELVARHRIDPAALAQRSGDELTVREIALGRGAYVRGRLALLMAVAEAHDARVVFGATPSGTIAYVAGHASDVDVVEVMYTSLHSQAASQMSAERRATSAATQSYRRAFLFGYADRVAKSFDEVRKAAEAASPTTVAVDGGGRSLARLERGRRVDEFIGERFGRVRTARSAAGADVTGWSAGSVAAERADLGRRRVEGRRSLGPG
ncbi:MAG TPA: DUF2786 domain-containing protein [Ilumatobacteraceae bacterium]|nr:DUF2786 domain-containing protein [Ilumatobacteraceae bacterium]